MSSFLILCSNNKPCLHLVVTCSEKWILYDNWCHLSSWTKKKLQNTSQSQTCTQKRSWSLFGGLLLVWFTEAFRIPANHYIWEIMLSKSMKYTKNCNAWSWHWSTERAQLFSTTMPDHTSHNQLFKHWINWAMKCCLICHIHPTSCQLTTTSSSISTTFCRENASITSRRQKMLSKSPLDAEAHIFMLQE